MYRFLSLWLLISPSAWAISLTFQPPSVGDGQTSILSFEAPKGISKFSGVAGDSKLSFFPCPQSKTRFCALVPIPVHHPATQVAVSVSWEGGTAEGMIQVEDSKYRQERLKVDPSRVKPDPEALKRIQEEREVLRKVYDEPIAEPLWEGPMVKPGKGKITSGFGNKRLFNGELKSFHTGVDLRGSKSTRVYSANAGVVRIAQNFYFAGNLVLIDHGAGLFTAYAHLSKFKVKAGDKVKKHQWLGMAGATGRVTGPHIHWGTRVAGTLVDPIQFMKAFETLHP